MAFLKGAFEPVFFKPNTTASASAVEINNFIRRFDTSEDTDGSGCQTATKSPPGPNLHIDSFCLFISGIFI